MSKLYNIKVKSFVLFFLITCMVSYSQNKREVDNTVNYKVSDIFTYNEQISSFLQLEQVNQDVVNDRERVNNDITIQQIGFNNAVISNTASENSSLLYFQEGNENRIEGINNINSISENIIQRGNNNRVTNFSFGNLDTAKLNIIQEGNNLIFEKFGTNALTNDLQFRFQGNSQTITINSF